VRRGAARLDGGAAPRSFSRVPAPLHPILDLARRPVAGHRGNRAHAPENTLESFRQAVALGVDALEFDVRLTADGVAVVHHDPTVDRTTDGSGPVAAMTLAELRRLDAGARFTADGGRTFPYRGRDVRIPTLDEVLGAFPDTPLLIEIKTPSASAETKTVIERHASHDRCVVDAFDAASLTPFRGSPIALGAAQGEVAWLLAAAVARVPVRSVPYRALCIPRSFRGIPLPVGRFAALLAPLDCPVHVWTVNDPAEARLLWEIGVRGIISDDPGTMLRLRGELYGS
jgi:glycerophosphoryl diester phosphodiesterase